MRVLVVEDERKIAQALREGLEAERQEVVLETTGEGAYFRLRTEAFDLILLDLTLPGRDGLQILSSLRANGIKTPVLVLTARDSIEDRVTGLHAGADDYLVKPFAFAELVARIRALARRGTNDAPRLKVGDLVVDLLARSVTRSETNIELTSREFDLLVFLMKRDGQVVPRDLLARDLWKETARCTPLDNVIEVHVARLRKKIDSNHPTKLIHTIRGVGYVMRDGEP